MCSGMSAVCTEIGECTGRQLRQAEKLNCVPQQYGKVSVGSVIHTRTAAVGKSSIVLHAQ